MAQPKSVGSREVQAAIERLAAAIGARHAGDRRLLILGIANGGVVLARRLGDRLGLKRVGTLDISFHRDDIGTHPIPKAIAPTLVPGDVDGADVLLVDDVLFTGRTVKAALDELFDHGRPAHVELAVLVDRGCRRLPVAPDFVGITLAASGNEDVVVTLHDDPAGDRIEVRPREPRAKTAASAR
jgi:pyrimidine operon attenuation protein/uracil phosphoribosyltransferase